MPLILSLSLLLPPLSSFMLIFIYSSPPYSLSNTHSSPLSSFILVFIYSSPHFPSHTHSHSLTHFAPALSRSLSASLPQVRPSGCFPLFLERLCLRVCRDGSVCEFSYVIGSSFHCWSFRGISRCGQCLYHRRVPCTGTQG
jgi:hypothetical protein